MNQRYKIVVGDESIQGSKEWLEFRKGKITASMAPAIVGESPFMTKLELWESIIFDKPTEKNEAMERGNRLEPQAREWLNATVGCDYQPIVVESTIHPYFIASLDGYFVSDKGTPMICEIKCPGPIDHAIAISGQVPPKYKAQLTHQMDLVCVKNMIYVSYDGKDGVIVPVYLDEEYAKILSEEEFLFYNSLIDIRPPPATDRDWVESNSENLNILSEEYSELTQEIDELIDRRELVRKNILTEVIHPRTKSGKNRIQKIKRNGDIDWNSIMRNHCNIDYESYRKPSTHYWKIGY